MFNFDKANNVLEIYRIPYKERCTVYEKTDSYESYIQYVNHGLRSDIEEYLIPALNAAVGGTEDVPRLWLEKCEVVFDTTSDYQGHKYNSAFVSIASPAFPFGAKKFCIFKLPFMNEYGVLEREGKQYALINELVQDDDITYSREELKVITKRGCYINLKPSSKCPKVVFRGKNYSAFSVLFMLAQNEGLDATSLFNKFRAKDLISVFKTDLDLAMGIEYEPDKLRNVGMLDAFMSDAYSLVNVRERMNNVLSIDRAIGKMLSREIILSNGEEIPAETIITSAVIKKLKYHRVNEIYVMKVPKMSGMYLAEDVDLPMLRKGTELLPIVREKLPDESGLYLARNVNFDGGFLRVEEGTLVDNGLLEMLAYNGISGVRLKPSLNSNVIEEVPFEYEIIGNRHFKASDLGLSDSNEYVYVNEDGTIEKPKQYITAYDMAAMISLFDRLEKNEDLDSISSRDLGLRKKVNQANELFHKAFELAVPEFVRMIKRKYRETFDNAPTLLNKPDEMEAQFFLLADKWWKKLYTDLKVIQPIDYSNPLAYYSSLSKISSIVKDSHQITDTMQRLSLGHYGRICPYETPSGKKIGVVNNKATGLKIIDGIMHTSYFKVKHIGGNSYITKEVVWLSVEQEEHYRIADISSVNVDASGKILTKGRVLARIPSQSGLEKMSVSYIDINKVDLVNTDSNQSLSLTATTIPFVGANDSARVTFGLGMCKQAKGLVYREVPIVMTSAFIDVPRKSPYFMVNAEYDGEVVDVIDGAVTMYYYELNDTKTYEFEMKEFRNQSVIIRNIEVEVGDIVKAGDILVSSNFTKDGFMATGVNALVGYIPQGYNYEDGVYASKRVKHKLTSYGANTETTPIPKKFKSTVVSPLNKFMYTSPNKAFCEVKFLHKSSYISKRIVSRKLKGFLVDVNKDIDKYKKTDKALIAHSVSLDYVNAGDKQANRHGNKGVSPELRENIEMPRLKNGEFLDICYNQIGVSSRMNIGQIIECHLGLACKVLGIRARSDSFNGATIKDVKLLLSYAWHLANDSDPQEVVKQFTDIPKGVHEFCLNNIAWIKSWEGVFNEDGTAYLLNPRTEKFYETPILIGVNYIYKLVHESGKKVHARGGLCTEPYIEKTDAPPKGSSNRGGQRFGSMEIDALSAYGASNLIQELMNERGDNAVRRNNVTVDALHKGDAYKLDRDTGIRRSTEYFVNIMEALGVKIDFCGELPNNTKFENAQRRAYKSNVILTAKHGVTKQSVNNDMKKVSDALMED